MVGPHGRVHGCRMVGVTSAHGSPATHEGALLDVFWVDRRAHAFDESCQPG